MILNSRKVENEEALVKEALKEIGGEIVSVLPRSESVQEAEILENCNRSPAESAWQMRTGNLQPI